MFQELAKIVVHAQSMVSCDPGCTWTKQESFLICFRLEYGDNKWNMRQTIVVCASHKFYIYNV